MMVDFVQKEINDIFSSKMSTILSLKVAIFSIGNAKGLDERLPECLLVLMVGGEICVQNLQWLSIMVVM